MFNHVDTKLIRSLSHGWEPKFSNPWGIAESESIRHELRHPQLSVKNSQGVIPNWRRLALQSGAAFIETRVGPSSPSPYQGRRNHRQNSPSHPRCICRGNELSSRVRMGQFISRYNNVFQSKKKPEQQNQHTFVCSPAMKLVFVSQDSYTIMAM